MLATENMYQFIGYSIWLLLAATLPVSAYMHYRTKNKFTLLMSAGGLLIWDSAFADYFSEPTVVFLSGAIGAVNVTVMVKDSELGTYAMIVGLIFFIAGSLGAAITNGQNKGNAV